MLAICSKTKSTKLDKSMPPTRGMVRRMGASQG